MKGGYGSRKFGRSRDDMLNFCQSRLLEKLRRFSAANSSRRFSSIPSGRVYHLPLMEIHWNIHNEIFIAAQHWMLHRMDSNENNRRLRSSTSRRGTRHSKKTKQTKIYLWWQFLNGITVFTVCTFTMSAFCEPNCTLFIPMLINWMHRITCNIVRTTCACE